MSLPNSVGREKNGHYGDGGHAHLGGHFEYQNCNEFDHFKSSHCVGFHFSHELTNIVHRKYMKSQEIHKGIFEKSVCS